MASAKAKKLTLKEELFVAAYLANGGNATQAAIAAGYSEKTAYAKGSELCKRANVAAAIQRSKETITKKFKVNAERVVEEMSVIGFSDPRHYFISENGNIELAHGAPDSAMRAVKRFKKKIRVIPQKDGGSIVETESEFELWNKDAQLRNLGDYLKLFKENRADENAADDDLTPQQRKERIISILRVAAKRRQTSGKKKAG